MRPFTPESFRALISEKINLIDELKEIVQDNKETSQEFTLIISQQRQEIENLKSLLEQNNIEVSFLFKTVFYPFEEAVKIIFN